MNKTLQNIIAVVVGLILGSITNMAIVSISGSLVDLPEGVDPENLDSLKENLHRFKAANFIPPILAHMAGTFVGAFTAAKIAKTKKLTFALVIGAIFLIGGIMMVVLLPKTPIWVIFVDLGLAYIPTAWLAGKLAR